MRWRRILAWTAAVVLLGVALLWFNAWSILGRIQESRDASAEIHIRPLRGTVFLIEATREGVRPYSYVNALASLGSDGALLVDPMVSASLASRIDALLSDRGAPVRYVVNTHAHPDHTRGNVAFSSGAEIVAHREAAAEMAASLKPFPWLPATQPLPEEARPASTFETHRTLELNGERITLRHFGPAHTAGDAFVFFEQANVIHVGDTFLGGGGRAVAAPISGGSFEGLVSALGELVAVASPGAIVVGGHGELGEAWTLADVERYRTILRVAMDQVASARANGESLEDFIASAVVPGWVEWAEGESAEPLLRSIWTAEAQ